MRIGSYTTEEVAKLLKVSKLTVYDLIKKEELPAYRVGRQMRIDAEDLETYIQQLKTGVTSRPLISEVIPQDFKGTQQQTVISGQDISLDILSKYIEKGLSFTPILRAYKGSLTSLINLYRNPKDIVSLHLFDGDTGEYNVPYVKRILVGRPYIVYNLLFRKAGLYVQKGNPKEIHTWNDLQKKGVQFVNREHGAGIRVLIDEQLRINGILSDTITGYNWEETNHIAIASAIANGKADVGVGIEKIAQLVGVEFVPIITERYDLVILKTPENEQLIQTVENVLRSADFQTELQAVGGYDLSQTGAVMFETF